MKKGIILTLWSEGLLESLTKCTKPALRAAVPRDLVSLFMSFVIKPGDLETNSGSVRPYVVTLS